jgi:hypothetical protein
MLQRERILMKLGTSLLLVMVMMIYGGALLSAPKNAVADGLRV